MTDKQPERGNCIKQFINRLFKKKEHPNTKRFRGFKEQMNLEQEIRMKRIHKSCQEYIEKGGRPLDYPEYFIYQFYIDDNPQLELMFAKLFSDGFESMKGYYFHKDHTYNYSKTPFEGKPLWNPQV